MGPEDDPHSANPRNVFQLRNISLRANIWCRFAQDLCSKLGMEAQLHAGDALRNGCRAVRQKSGKTQLPSFLVIAARPVNLVSQPDLRGPATLVAAYPNSSQANTFPMENVFT